LGIPQITYAEEFIAATDKDITIKRRLERGIEVVKSSLPALITVHSSAPECRPRNAKLLMKFKHARTVTELQEEVRDYTELFDKRPYLQIDEWTVADLDANVEFLGLSGSPTKVKKIENVVLQQKETILLTESDKDIEGLMKELIDIHIIG
jgi:electron transfer flavoprotein beta subunit